MVQKNEHHTFTGMQKDIAISKHPSKYLFDARNIRLTQREDGSTLLAITNEKGTEDTELEITGIYLGHCVLNQYLVVFSKDVYSGDDHIERFDLSQDPVEKVSLYDDPLNFSLEHPIEAIGSYENEDVQKVYWTDGYNQPRVINIMDSENYAPTDTYFDFVNTLKLEEEVEVQKMFGNNGMFAPGVIQYAFTYYHKYGQESNIFYTTPLYYISYLDRGASPEDKVVENTFKITVKHIDSNFEYLRIYSIQRTSINGTPIVKRVQDISLKDIENDTVSFIDTGTTGDTVDPTELLYKGGEYVKVGTLEQKDGTLFLGNIEIARENVKISDAEVSNIAEGITSSYRSLYTTNITSGNYTYDNQLTSFEDEHHTISTPCAGFKRGNYYRLGLQFQHETGKWSDPIYIADKQEEKAPYALEVGEVSLPCFTGEIPGTAVIKDGGLAQLGYKKVRPVVVYPELYDKTVICQGVANPTMYTTQQRGQDKNLYAQSSWFFRPYSSNAGTANANGAVYPTCNLALNYTYNINERTQNASKNYNPTNIRAVEIQGDFGKGTAQKSNKFLIDRLFLTLHSPDVEFDDDYKLIDYSLFKGRQIGHALFTYTMSDIDIQTETPTISNDGGGFVHKSFSQNKAYGIVSGLFYDDYSVDENSAGDTLMAYPNQKSSMKWMVYLWNKSGSLNNDINRPANLGTASAILKKKVISNLRYAMTSMFANKDPEENDIDLSNAISKISLFYSDQLSVVKLPNLGDSDWIYMGNIDTMLNPDASDGMYFAFENDAAITNIEDASPSFTHDIKWKTCNDNDNNAKDNGYYHWSGSVWGKLESNLGDKYVDLTLKKQGVRMKYKSTPHLIFSCSSGVLSDTTEDGLPIVEIIRDDIDITKIFGGTSADALKANTWIPCGAPVVLRTDGLGTPIEWSWGDTYYQRWDCLKTYAFTPEDINQVVEIGSFMLETYVNIDGRYDRNRGQLSNLNMSPQNFNLLNPVYSQLNNFFTYKILDEDYYKNNTFPNQITWTKEKHAGADVDLWTNITLASTYDMDGSKGKIVSLNAWKDQLFCFQDKGISNILFNSRVQIPTSDGVPIEISNNYKVDGYRYLSDGIGCSNKWTIKETPASIYFIDSTSHHLYSIGEGFTNLTVNKNMGSWFNSNGALINKTVYDDVHHDVYLVKDDEALCYSELLGEFTSFMDYGGMNVLESYQGKVFSMKGSLSDKHLYKMFTGNYNYFFDAYKPWYLTFISNGIDESAMDFDKIFSNIDYRLDFFEEPTFNETTYNPDASFDFMRAWNEYQDTQEVTLSSKNDGKGYKTAKFYRGGNPQKKFRIWRIQIPRAKKLKNGQYVPTNDRMRNPWCKITLGKNADESNMKAVLQDLNVQYFL